MISKKTVTRLVASYYLLTAVGCNTGNKVHEKEYRALRKAIESLSKERNGAAATKQTSLEKVSESAQKAESGQVDIKADQSCPNIVLPYTPSTEQSVSEGKGEHGPPPNAPNTSPAHNVEKSATVVQTRAKDDVGTLAAIWHVWKKKSSQKGKIYLDCILGGTHDGRQKSIDIDKLETFIAGNGTEEEKEEALERGLGFLIETVMPEAFGPDWEKELCGQNILEIGTDKLRGESKLSSDRRKNIRKKVNAEMAKRRGSPAQVQQDSKKYSLIGTPFVVDKAGNEHFVSIKGLKSYLDIGVGLCNGEPAPYTLRHFWED